MNQVEIRVKGHIDPQWSEWLEGLAISHEEEGLTILMGPLVDQPTLYGILTKLRDMGLSLTYVMIEENEVGNR